jgi:glycerol uptake facilitator-like aquaporin
MEKKAWLKQFCSIKNQHIRCFLAELLGTFVFLTFSLGGVAQFILGKTGIPLAVNISFGFGLTIAIVIAGKISGISYFYCLIYFNIQ